MREVACNPDCHNIGQALSAVRAIPYENVANLEFCIIRSAMPLAWVIDTQPIASTRQKSLPTF